MATINQLKTRLQLMVTELETLLASAHTEYNIPQSEIVQWRLNVLQQMRAVVANIELLITVLDNRPQT